jgi:hypothetical protein
MGTTNAQREVLKSIAEYAASKNIIFKLTEMY